jgi:hypothetical protein
MDNRDEKRGSLIERITALTATPVMPNPGDEWPTLVPEQVEEFRELVHNLANLCFEPDFKERSVLDIIVSDKKRYDTEVFFTEKNRDLYDADLSEREFMEGFSRATRQATMMIDRGQEMLRRYSDIASYRASTRAKTEERDSELATARTLLDDGKLDEFRAEADRLMGKYDPRPRDEDDTYRSVPEELQAMIDDYGIELKRTDAGVAQIEEAVNEIMVELDKVQPLVGVYHRDVGRGEPSFDRAIGEARSVLNKHRYRVGTRALQPAVVRFNRLSNEHRAIQSMKERGLKVSLEPVTA